MFSPPDEDGWIVSRTRFSFVEQIGIFLLLEAGVLSGASIIFLILFKLFLFLRNRIRSWRIPRARLVPSDAADSSLFLSLMTGELLRVIGNLMSFRWIIEGALTEDTFCRTQGMIKTIATGIIDFSTLAITLHTFLVLILQWNAPKHIAKYLTLAVWLIVALTLAITNVVRGPDLMGPTNYWCWIKLKYKTEQLMAEYVWMWSVAILTVIFYGIGFLVMRGFIIFDEGRLRWPSRKKRIPMAVDGTETEDARAIRAVANQLLYYPVVYVVCVFPQSVSRWLYFSGHTVRPQFSLFASTLFALSGLFNVILFFKTRRALIMGPPAPAELPPAPVPGFQSAAPRGARKHGHLPFEVDTEKYGYSVDTVPISGTTRESRRFDNSYTPESDRVVLERGGQHRVQRSESRELGSVPFNPYGMDQGRPTSAHARVVSSSVDGSPATITTSRSAADDDDEDDGYGRLPG